MKDYKPVSIADVRVQDRYAVRAGRRNVAYLLSLETGRLLAGFYENAGIRTPFVRYGGWESMLIGGHTLGHYLSALSLAGASSDGEEREELFSRARAVVDGLAECQRAMGSGLVWGATPTCEGGPEAQFDHVERGKTNIVKEAWVPWYTLHKILAGLIDAYEFTGFPRALEVADRLGDWVAARVLTWTKRVQRQVLSVEYGGMNAALYQLYGHTAKETHLRAAHMFDEEPLFDLILSEAPNNLKDRHANMTIPKVLGALERYYTLRSAEAGEAARYLAVAETFFRTVIERHTYATGGNSEWEHFGSDYVLDAERTNCNCETCNVYNMLKLARRLYQATGKREYLDYYDNAFTNAILSSQNPETGMTTYFQPMAGGFFKVFSRPYDKFWCCTGSGMESFGKLGDGIWYSDGDGLILGRYLSCRLQTEAADLSLDCDFPFRDTAIITVNRGKGIRLSLLLPAWRKGKATLRINGREAACEGDYAKCTADAGDVITLTIPVGIRAVPLPDAKTTVAFFYGGVLLSCGLGSEEMEEAETGVEVTIPKKRILATETVYFNDVGDVLAHPERYFVRDGESFVLSGDISLTFTPHYKKYKERYAIYIRLAEGERKEEREERAPLDVVQPGYGQYETDNLHALDERDSVSVTSDGTCRYARPRGYFSYDFRVDPAAENTIVIFLRRADNGKMLKVTAGEDTIFEERLLYTMGEEMYSREIAIPASTVAAYSRVKRVNGEAQRVLRICFSGAKGRQSARVCEFIRIYTKES